MTAVPGQGTHENSPTPERDGWASWGREHLPPFFVSSASSEAVARARRSARREDNPGLRRCRKAARTRADPDTSGALAVEVEHGEAARDQPRAIFRAALNRAPILGSRPPLADTD